MTDKLKCPFCGAELQTDNEIARLIMWRCHTPSCLLNGWHSVEIIQHLIDGKKAQHQLRTAKDRCAKKTKAKEREIAKYLNGINVRDKEIQNLREQLQKTQDELKGIEMRVVAIRSCVQDGYSQLGERNRNIFIALELFKDLIKEITSITKQE